MGNALCPAESEIERFCRDLGRLASGGILAVAVSGGPDSLALLLLAAAARPGAVIAATADHGLRSEAPGEVRFVADICAMLGVEHVGLTVHVADHPAGIQAAARRARYDALEKWALREGASHLATGHHLDDQAETVLMRLRRGAGVAGLRGIRERRTMWHGLPLVRPLLGWRRTDLRDIVTRAGLVAVDDPSNRDMRFDRSVARSRLDERWIEPRRLAAVARHMADADEALSHTGAVLFAERYRPGPPALLAAADLPREYRRRLLVRTFAALSPAASPRGDDIDRLLDRLAGGIVSTLAGFRIDPGPAWRFTPTPPHRAK